MLDPFVEAAFVDHILHHPTGIYYVYDREMTELPKRFDSLQISRYIAALECLAGYHCVKEKLSFASEWLLANEGENGWDLGATAKDGVCFPLSDSW